MGQNAILFYPWMRKNGIVVFPHRDALAKDQTRFRQLFAWRENQTPKTISGGKPRNGEGVKPILAMPFAASTPLKFGHEPGS